MKNDKNWRDYLVLAALGQERKHQMDGTIITVITILELVSHFSDIEFNLNKTLDPDAIEDARKRLITRGYLVENGGQTDKDAHNMLDSLIPRCRSETCRRAIEFSARILNLCSAEQREALLTLILCESVAEWEGWISEGQTLREAIEDRMPDELHRLDRALTITDRMRTIWNEAETYRRDPTSEGVLKHCCD